MTSGLLAVLCAGPALGADLKVPANSAQCSKSLEKGIYCSLKEAISVANRKPDPDVIHLEEGATYRLSEIDHQNEGGNGLPAIEGPLIIEGNGSSIERSKDFKVPEFRLFRVASAGHLTLRQVTLRNGATPRGYDGAGIWSIGALTLESAVVENNHSGDDGGGIRSDGALKISDSLIRGNTARWRGGVGGGLQSPEQFGKAKARIERVTFTGNEAWAGGGAVWLEGSTLLQNVTITGNRAGKRGGGIENYGVLELQNCTVVDNQAGVDAGGLHSFRPVTIGNTILVGNRAMISPDCDSELISRGYNLLGELYRCVIQGDATGNQIGGDAGLAPLAEVDGVWVHHPRPGSPVIDKGSPLPAGSSDEACPAIDQRHKNRAGDPSRCDIGAVEVGS